MKDLSSKEEGAGLIEYALILILIVIYRNAPGLKGFREKYNLQALWAKLFAKKTEAAETDAKEEQTNG